MINPNVFLLSFVAIVEILLTGCDSDKSRKTRHTELQGLADDHFYGKLNEDEFFKVKKEWGAL